jgi:winged helix DNA-binding protein
MPRPRPYERAGLRAPGESLGFSSANPARALLCIAHDPGVRLRDIATTLGVTERSAYAVVTDLAEAGYVVKEKDGRRNRYQIQADLPLPDAIGRERTIGEVLGLLVDANARSDGQRARR